MGPNREQRITGGVVGLLIGDALGVPYEFHTPQQLPPTAEIEFEPPANFQRAHLKTPPGTWSDDGAQALCLLDSLLECGRLDTEDFGRRLLAWYEHGYLAVDHRVFDVGITTGIALRNIRAGATADDAGPGGDYDNGNGSLMRALPLALWHRGSNEELVRDAQMQSRVTHGHLRSQVCCALYCLWGRYELQNVDHPWEKAVAALRRIYASDEAAHAELEWSIRPDDEPNGTGSGYVVDSLRSARWALRQPDYEQAVKAAIGLGNDTDTIACIAGGIAGIRYGVDAIPERWRSVLRGQSLYEPLLHRLISRQVLGETHCTSKGSTEPKLR